MPSQQRSIILILKTSKHKVIITKNTENSSNKNHKILIINKQKRSTRIRVNEIEIQMKWSSGEFEVNVSG